MPPLSETPTARKKMAERILEAVKGIESPKIAVLGLAFKDGTDDCRESPAMEIVAELVSRGADITAYDPKAARNAQNLIGEQISYAKDMYEALQNADVLAVLTEWNEFKSLDLNKAAGLMRNRKIVDCRNLLNRNEAEKAGFTYQGIGL